MLKGLIIGILVLLFVFVVLIFADTVYHQPITSSGSMKIELSSAPIIFISNRDGNNEVYVTDATGQNQYRLTNNSQQDILPTISPDKKKFVYYSEEEGIHILHSCTLSAFECLGVTKISQEPISLIYSPDGQHLLSSQKEQGKTSLWLVSLQDFTTELVDTDTGDGQWSPDSKIVVYEKDLAENRQIWMRAIDSQNNLDQPVLVVDLAAAPLPDSSKLYYIDLSGPAPQLVRSTLRGKDKETIIDLPDTTSKMTFRLERTDYPSLLLLISDQTLPAVILSLTDRTITPLDFFQKDPEYIAADVMIYEKEDENGRSQIWIENKEGEQQLTSEGENWL